MPEEIDLILERITKKSSREIGRRIYTEGTWCGHEVVVVFSRWGKVAASSTVTTLLDEFKVDQILFTGVAGGVDPSLEMGDIVIADLLIQHDLDASPVPGIEKFEIPLLGVTRIPVSASLVSRAREAAELFIKEILHDPQHRTDLKEVGVVGPRIFTGLAASGDQFIADPRKLESLRKELPGLLCVEMEGAAVAQVCHERGIPFLVIRTISDKANHEAVVDFPKFLKKVSKWFSAGILEKYLQASE